MKNKTVKLVLAIVVLGILTGGYFGLKSYVAGQEAAEEEEQEEENTVVFDTETDAIKSIKFTIDDTDVTFIKEDGSWIIEDEKDFPVDQDILDSAASYLASVSADRVLEDVEDLGEYELDDPQNTITVTTAVTDTAKEDEDTDTSDTDTTDTDTTDTDTADTDTADTDTADTDTADIEEGSDEVEEDAENAESTVTTVLRIGMLNDSTSQYYVCKDEDETTVYVVDENVFSSFMDNSLYDFAEMETFPDIDSSTVKKVTVDQEDGSYEAEKDADSGLWQINGNGDSEKADSAKMSSLTSSLGSLEYNTFVDYDCTDESEYGLDDPYATVTIDYEEEIETDDEEEADSSEAEEDSSENESVSENAEDAEAAEDVEDDEIDEDVSEKTETVSKQLVFFVGDETDDDSRYVMLEGDKQVYTMTNELLSTVIDKDLSTMLDLTVNYLSVNDLDSLDVELDGKKKTIDVSRETIAADSDKDSEEETEDEEDSEAETETVVTYFMDGVEVDSISFTTFYNKLINLAGEKRLMEKYEPETEPEMTCVFHNLDGESVNVDFYEYDVNYYAAVVDNSKVFLVNKMNFKELRSSYEEMISEEGEDADVEEDVEETETEAVEEK